MIDVADIFRRHLELRVFVFGTRNRHTQIHVFVRHKKTWISADRRRLGWHGQGPDRSYRPSTGQWFLDLNEDSKLDSCTTDARLGPFGQAGDLPVVGKWLDTTPAN